MTLNGKKSTNNIVFTFSRKVCPFNYFILARPNPKFIL